MSLGSYFAGIQKGYLFLLETATLCRNDINRQPG
jgi:hypothetical protein